MYILQNYLLRRGHNKKKVRLLIFRRRNTKNNDVIQAHRFNTREGIYDLTEVKIIVIFSNLNWFFSNIFTKSFLFRKYVKFAEFSTPEKGT